MIKFLNPAKGNIERRNAKAFMKLNTDRLRVKQILEERGPRGIHSFELKTIDLHKDRYIARVGELEKEGMIILHTRERMGDSWGTRYTFMGYRDSMTSKVIQTVKTVNETTKHFLRQEFHEVKRTKGGIPKGQLTFI